MAVLEQWCWPFTVTWLAQSAEQQEETPELSSEAHELPLPCLAREALGTPILNTSSLHGLECRTRNVEEEKEDTAVKLSRMLSGPCVGFVGDGGGVVVGCWEEDGR